MAHTFEELKKKTVAELREIAKGVEHEAVKGYSQLNKQHLLVALSKGLGIDAHAHHAHLGAEKERIKKRIRELKKTAADAIAKHDATALKSSRRAIHNLKRAINRM